MKIDRVFSCFLIGTLILTLLFISQNLKQKSLTYDEAGQFFISKGLNHDSEPFAKEKGLKDVIENNGNYNLDPGGFSILLHYWSKVSNYHTWLRILPFIFFVGFICSFVYLFYFWFSNINIALLAGFIPIISRSGYMALGFEIRAYSMEYLGTMLCVVALLNLKGKITNQRLFIWACIFSFFITSRYSELIVVFVASLIILYFIYLVQASLKQKLFSCFIYACPLIITVIYIVFSAQIHQNKNLIELDYVLYLSRDYKEMITFSNLVFIGLIVFLGFLFAVRNRFLFLKKYETILLFTLLVNILFLILSIFGAYPWMPLKKQCISFFLLVNVCVAAIVFEIGSVFSRKVGLAKYYLIGIGLVSILFLRRGTFNVDSKGREDFYKILTNIDLDRYQKIYVESASSSPSVRYLFEFGALRLRKNMGYPDRFTFGKFIKHHIIKGGETHEEYLARQPKLNSYLDYDMVICNKLSRYGNNDKWRLLKGTTCFYVKK